MIDFSFSESFSFFNEKEKDDIGFGIRVGPCDSPTTQKTKKDTVNCILFVFDFTGINSGDRVSTGDEELTPLLQQ